MKNLLYLFALLLTGQIAVAQQVITEESDPKATALLDKVNTKFDAYNSYELDFSMTIKSPEAEAPMVHKGKFIRKGKQYRVITHDQKIYCDGQNVWVYAPESNDVQINDADDSDDFVSPDKLFSMYKTGDFLYHFSRESNTLGKNLVEIEFKPTDKMSDFFKIKMIINTSTNQPQSIKIFYKDGLRVTTTLSGLKKNKTYDKGFFTFDKAKFPGVKIEDLRL